MTGFSARLRERVLRRRQLRRRRFVGVAEVLDGEGQGALLAVDAVLEGSRVLVVQGLH